MINWIKIEENAELPQEEVIALKEDTQQIAVGYLGVQKDGVLICDEEYSVLEKPTHYILKKDLINIV